MEEEKANDAIRGTDGQEETKDASEKVEDGSSSMAKEDVLFLLDMEGGGGMCFQLMQEAKK